MEVNMAQLLANSPAGGPVQGEGGLFAIKASDSSAAGYGVVGITAAVDVLGDMRGTSPLDSTRPLAGVYGISDLPPGPNTAGVLGENFQDGPGVLGQSKANDGVQGIASQTGRSGVTGINSGGGNGVFGQSQSGRGVVGTCSAGVGVSGESNQGDGVQGNSNSGAGVAGASASGVGVHGANHTASDAAIFGINDTPGQQVPDGPNRKAGAGSGVWGHTKVEKGAGVVGSVEPGLSQAVAGRFFGNVEATGTVTCFDVALSGADCAEEFELACLEVAKPGAVMSFDQNGVLTLSTQAYDKRVAGVVSGAGDYKPGILLDRQQGQENRAALALVGKVYCLADARHGSIDVGDLLTTSTTPGHAMRVTDYESAFGSVIGKAMRPLAEGQGLIPVLIALR
jgi:hypothetical protein